MIHHLYIVNKLLKPFIPPLVEQSVLSACFGILSFYDWEVSIYIQCVFWTYKNTVLLHRKKLIAKMESEEGHF